MPTRCLLIFKRNILYSDRASRRDRPSAVTDFLARIGRLPHTAWQRTDGNRTAVPTAPAAKNSRLRIDMTPYCYLAFLAQRILSMQLIQSKFSSSRQAAWFISINSFHLNRS